MPCGRPAPVLPRSIHRSPAPFAAGEPDAPEPEQAAEPGAGSCPGPAGGVDEVDAPLLHLEGRAYGRGR
ncbi:hypothetical protein KIL84_000280, partial [Mauremys mutica]